MGDQYKGWFENDKFEGKGELIYCRRGVYRGDFVNGKKEGTGNETYPNGDHYYGPYENGFPHGKDGVFTALIAFTSNVYAMKYYGEFYNGFRHGVGKCIYPDGSEYEGNFRWN